MARAHCARLAEAKGPTVFLMPKGGCGEWDRPGDLHDAEGLAAFIDTMEADCPANVDLREINAHINDPACAEAALAVFDDWCAKGIVKRAL